MTQHRVLVINDVPDQCDIIRRAIEGLCEVVAPASHEELVERLAEGRLAYPIVFLDYWFAWWEPMNTPPRNGEEVLQLLRPNNEDTPYVIFLTQYLDDNIKRIARKYHVPVATLSNTPPRVMYASVEVLLKRIETSRGAIGEQQD